MNVNDCLKLLREIKDVSFGTVDKKGNPQVRIIDVMYVDENSLYFLTARGKDFYHELIQNSKVSICALTNDFKSIRILSSVKKVDDQNLWLNKIFLENPAMNDVYPGESRYILEVFCLDKGEVEFFDLSVNPIFRKTFSLNNGKIAEKGFEISDDCIQCGNCHDNCPQGIINKGNPYKIQQEHCLHCGLCFENCPISAISRK